MLALLLLFACPKPAPEPEAPEATTHVWHGPWEEGGLSLTLAATAPGEGEAMLAGPVILVAAWVKEGELLFSTSLSSGRSWTPPIVVAEGVSIGDAGQVRPRLALADGGPVIAFAREGKPQLARRGREGWTIETPSPEAKGELVDLAVHYGRPVLAWLDNRRGGHTADVYALVDGQEEAVYVDNGDGVCPCCRPALGEQDGQIGLAFRDADGPGRELRLALRGEAGWEDLGLQTRGGWAPGGCPADGPAWQNGAPLISDARDGARKLYRGDVLIPGSAGWQITQPRAVGETIIRLESKDGTNRVVLGNTPLLSSEDAIELGDPLALSDLILLPVNLGESTALVVWDP